MKRKFQFEIPRLKIGSSRVETKTSHDPVSLHVLDSPPVTPKSVRPPLPPDVDAELRKACAVVLENFKPSTQLYDEGHAKSNNDEHSGIDYAAIRKAVREELDASMPAARRLNNLIKSRAAKVEPDPLEDMDPARFRYKPSTATENLFEQEDYKGMQVPNRVVAHRNDLLMSTSLEQFKVPANSGNRPHAQTVSLPFRASMIAADVEQRQRPKPALRADSNDTAGSTPRTDATEYPCEGSTAPTSVMATPARSSKRASSQALHFGPESGVAKIDAADAEWMRLELEKHKKAQEELKLQQEPQASTSAVDLAAASGEQSSKAHMAARQTPMRRPVLRTSSDQKRRSTHQRVDSSQSREDAVSKRQLSVAPQPQDQEGTEHLRPESKHKKQGSMGDRHQIEHALAAKNAQEDITRPESRSRSISQGVKNYFRPSTEQVSTRQNADLPRPESRSRSITRQVQDYVRPGSAMGSRKASADRHRGLSRSQSTESITEQGHSAAASSSHQWKSWKPWGRNRNGSVSSDSTRPESSGSASRGRQTDRDTRPSRSAQHVKCVDLNRELPPLPGLDQWKEPEPIKEKEHEPKQPKQVTSKVSSGETIRQVRSDGDAGRQPAIRKQTVFPKAKQIPTPPNATLTAPPGLRVKVKDLVTISTVDAESSPISPPISPISIGSVRERRTSRSLLDAYLDGQSQTATGKPITVAKAQLVDNTPAVGTQLGPKSRDRAYPHASMASTSTYVTALGHSRMPSEDNVNTDYVRKPSLDDYGRVYQTRHQNVTELSVIDATTNNMIGQFPSSTTNSKTNKKWWQRSKKERDWMEQVVKSGNHSGLILTDEAASAPVVRY